MGRLGATVAGTDPCSTGGHPQLQLKEKRRLQMNKFRITIKLAVIATFLFAFASMTQAQATRTWVSGVGDDANPCSRTAPCKTFAGAISKTADPGEIDALDPGGFGAVTITKSITIDGTGTFASILASGTQGIVVNGTGKVVRIRGLSINGAGTTLGTNGINFVSGASVSVEDSVIDNFTTAGINVSASTAALNNLNLRNVVIRNCGTGVNINNTGTNATVLAFDNVMITRSGNNLNIQNGGRGQISRSFFGLSPTASGINATQGTSATDVSVNDSTMVGNQNGITAGGGHIRIARCVITGNTNALGLLGGTVDTGGNNTIMGNGTNQDPNGTLFIQK
jgi:hypothetical protein